MSEINEEPTIGGKVTCLPATDRRNRPCAKQIRYVADGVNDAEEERAQMAADYQREERTARAQALRRASGGNAHHK